jgi:purine-nucleoside/S-methyl-5'-thioadenosine phosphorylase / adenosine deaminase
VPELLLDSVVPLDDGRRAHVRFTSALDGDLSVRLPLSIVGATRDRLLPLPWTFLHQVHGADVVVVEYPGDRAGADADAAVTNCSGAPLAIHTADCTPIALIAREGVVGAAHAGWRGLEAGVVEATVERMRSLGATDVSAVVGPGIRPECYEFGDDDLDRLATAYGPEVRGTTADGQPALDMPAGVAAALAAAGVEHVETSGICTSCDGRFFSHRARQDTGRQALLVWLE